MEECDELVKEIVDIEAKSEDFILLGDLNSHIGTFVKDNHPRESVRGKLLVDLVSNEKYTLVNALNVVVNGPFTRFDPKEPDNEEKMSLLDIVVVSSNLAKYIDKLEIDRKIE